MKFIPLRHYCGAQLMIQIAPTGEILASPEICFCGELVPEKEVREAVTEALKEEEDAL